jgi:hypothetical protein
MSLERLLFFLLPVAIPLLEKLIRAMRAQTGDSPGERALATVAERTVSRLAPPLSAHDAGATASDGERTRVGPEHQHGPAAPVRTGHSQWRVPHSTTPQRVIAGADLRRAIVLIALLGPCRALEPKDASQLR